MTSLLKRLILPRRKRIGGLITVYTRQECCCCHKAIDLLKKYQRKHRFTIEEVDVDSDSALVARHGEWVPVVEMDGKVRFRGVVNPVLLERLLNAQEGDHA